MSIEVRMNKETKYIKYCAECGEGMTIVLEPEGLEVCDECFLKVFTG